MGNYLRTAHRLLGFRLRQEQWDPSLYCGQLEAQLNRYLVYLFQDHGFSLSRPATGHSPATSVRHGLAALSSALIAPLVSSPCPCDTPVLGGPLTNRQPAENSWILGDPILHCYVPFTGIHNLTKKSDRVSFVRGALSKIQPIQNIVTWPIRGPT